MNMHIFDNIGCSFSLSNSNDFIIGAPLPGYKTLDRNNKNVYIPYLARNIDNNNISWEIGIGLVYEENNTIYVKREQIKSSSNDDKIVDFNKNGNKQFYLFVNTGNFNTGFNNVFIKDQDFTVGETKGIYIVDVSSGLVHGDLPDPKNVANLAIEFRTVGTDGNLVLKDPTGFSVSLSGTNRYTSLVSTGDYWIELKDIEISKKAYKIINKTDELQALSTSQEFNVLSDPSGDDRSLQFNNNGAFDATSVYWGANDQLLFGNTTPGLAKNIIPSSGNYPLVVNNTKENSDFIVYGSGNGERNLFFTYDGKLGINIPTGVRPQTILHVINSYCQESLRVENRSTCYPADLTIYHRPPVDVADNSIISRVKLSSKNKAGNKIDYVQLVGKSKSTNTGSTKGQFDLVVNSAATGITTITSDPDRTTIGYSGSLINVSPTNISGIVGSSSLAVGQNNILLNSPTVSVSGLLSANNVLINSGLIIPNIESNTLLALNSNKQLAPATGFRLSGIGSNKILSSNSSGTIVGSLDINTFLASYNDITWNKYPTHKATACLRQLTFVSGVPAEQFSVGDQIAIVPPSGSTIYRIVDEIEYSNPSTISTLLLDQKLVTDITDSDVYSVSKGGYLVNQLYPGSGVIADSTAIILSTRPNKDTEFNTQKKNINFKVYGIEDTPALGVVANASFRSVNSGVYFGFATHVKTGDGIDIDPFPVQINAVGQGQSPSNNSINFSYASLPFWSGMVSTVGTNGRRSFYGTYDQNGNVFEWIEDSEIESNNTVQKICGGSWRTTTLNGLRSIINTPYNHHLDDVGFRVCCRYGLNDDSVQGDLNLSFVSISQLDNIVDDIEVFTESSDNRFGLNDQPEPTSIQNIGKVYNPYQIGKFEITNSQYATFLNAIAKTDVYTIYNTEMSDNVIGGIARSGSNGSYEYIPKENMLDKPVVFVDYLSAIRFTNWLHNGAPTGTGENAPASYVTEDGAYTINIAGSTTVVKNRDQRYWLPSLNEWHKAAYFQPIVSEELARSSAVTIRRPLPYEISSGIAASLSVSGHIYADNLIVGTSGTGGNLIVSSVSGDWGSVKLATGQPSGIVYIGPDNAITIDEEGSRYNGVYRNQISNTGIVLASSGNIKLVSNNLVETSGIKVSKVLTESLDFIDAGGNIIQGGQHPGPNGGFIFKNLNNNNTTASSALKNVEAEFTITDDEGNETTATGVFPTLESADSKQPIYMNAFGYLDGYEYVRFGDSVDGIQEECVVVGNPPDVTGVPSPALVVDKIRIGPALPSFSGSILMHQGEGLAEWAPADYLRADGVTWTRYKKRALELTSINTAIFINRPQSTGGTGDVSAEDIFREFGLDETIAITNASKQTVYAKVANFVLIDSDQVVTDDFFTNESTLLISFCPPLSQEFFNQSAVDSETGSLVTTGSPSASTIKLAYAHSVQKGGYLDMGIDQSAVSGFNCDALSPTSPYRFKPSTANTISIRPNVHTSFNKVAEDIDFAIYGYKDTLYNRYEPEIFATGTDGLPSGLNPAFYVNVNIENSVVGSIESGVSISGYLNTENSLVTGILLDESAKITINNKSPYVISTITATSGYDVNGIFISGSNPLSTYADLTVNGYTFSSGIISNNFSYNPNLVGQDKKYIPNAPLTINSLGQLVSLVPPPPATVPDAPTAVVGLGGNQSITLNWTVPVNNGGRQITNYTIEYSDDDGNTWVIFERPISTEQSAIITGLVNGISYKFRVSAINEVGSGPVSEVSAFISPTSDAPGQPLNLIANRGFLQVSLSWSAPITSGSSSITDYRIEYARIPDPYSDTLEWITFPDGVGTETSVTITGLLNGPTYVFRVAAQNSSGIGVPTSLVKSVGTDPEPLPPSVEPPQTISDNWDFGEIVFTGVCL